MVMSLNCQSSHANSRVKNEHRIVTDWSPETLNDRPIVSEPMNNPALTAFLSFVLYTVAATLLLAGSIKIFDLFFKANIQKEVFENRNTAAGVVLAGLLLGVAIIAASAMH
jgi:hypothetical protein